MKPRIFLVAMQAAMVTSINVSTAADVQTQWVDVPETNKEFVVCLPLDRKSVERNWQYVLRYVHNEPEANLSFSLMLVKGAAPGQYILALHEGREMSFEEFDAMSEEEKLAVAEAKRTIDTSLAQTLYDTWVRALLRARYGDDGGTSTGADRFYVSAFGINTGYMSAECLSYRRHATTGKIVRIGLLLRRYLEEPDGAEADKLVEQIRDLCSK